MVFTFSYKQSKVQSDSFLCFFFLLFFCSICLFSRLSFHCSALAKRCFCFYGNLLPSLRGLFSNNSGKQRAELQLKAPLLLADSTGPRAPALCLLPGTLEPHTKPEPPPLLPPELRCPSTSNFLASKQVQILKHRRKAQPWMTTGAFSFGCNFSQLPWSSESTVSFPLCACLPFKSTLPLR